MAKTTRSSSGKAKKATGTKTKPAKESVSPKKKAASSGGTVVSIEACKQVRYKFVHMICSSASASLLVIYLNLGLSI